MFTVTCR